jgi:hypothetical protein
MARKWVWGSRYSSCYARIRFTSRKTRVSRKFPKRSAVTSAEYRVQNTQDTRPQRAPRASWEAWLAGLYLVPGTWYPRDGLPQVRVTPGDIRTTLKGPSRDTVAVSGEEQLCLFHSQGLQQAIVPSPVILGLARNASAAPCQSASREPEGCHLPLFALPWKASRAQGSLLKA